MNGMGDVLLYGVITCHTVAAETVLENDFKNIVETLQELCPGTTNLFRNFVHFHNRIQEINLVKFLDMGSTFPGFRNLALIKIWSYSWPFCFVLRLLFCCGPRWRRKSTADGQWGAGLSQPLLYVEDNIQWELESVTHNENLPPLLFHTSFAHLYNHSRTQGCSGNTMEEYNATHGERRERREFFLFYRVKLNCWSNVKNFSAQSHQNPNTDNYTVFVSWKFKHFFVT